MTNGQGIPEMPVLLALARAVASFPRNGTGPLDPSYEAVLEKIESLGKGHNRVEVLRTELGNLALDVEATIDALLELDPELPLQASGPLPWNDCPELPEEARLDPALSKGAGKWLDEYIAYARTISPMTPTIFHEGAALWLVSVAISRRLKLSMYFDEIYPNIWVAWLAETTLWRKSTGMSVARKMVDSLFPYLLTTGNTTPEALISDLAGTEPPNMDKLFDDEQEDWRKGRPFSAQRGMLMDEMSQLLASASRDYNAGMTEMYLKLYDCATDRRSTRSQGLIVVKNPYLAFLGASTPRALSSYLVDEKLWSMGWWPRFALLTPEAPYPEWQKGHENGDPKPIQDKVRELFERLPKPEWQKSCDPVHVLLDKDAFDAWDRYNKALSYDLLKKAGFDSRLFGSYGRLPTQVLKVSIILAALDWPKDEPSPRITLPRFAKALEIVEAWRYSAHRVLAKAAECGQEGLEQKVLRQLSIYGDKGATLRDLYKGMHIKNIESLDSAVRQLVKVGEAEEIEPQHNPSGGRPPKGGRYRIATHDRVLGQK